ncbi:unnamed protein product [Caretta caretta]
MTRLDPFNNSLGSRTQVYRVSVLLNLRPRCLQGFGDVPYLSRTWSLPAYVTLALLTLLLGERENLSIKFHSVTQSSVWPKSKDSGPRDKAKKLKFLDCVSTFSRAVFTRSPERNLAAFLSKALLVEKIKELIDHESIDSVTGVVHQQVMLAVMELSKVKPLLWGMEQSSLLATCFSSIFSLPPAQAIQGVETALNTKTLKAMDEMQKALVCKDQKPNLVVLQNILKGVEEFRVLGQLVGCPTLCCAEQEQEIFRWVVDGLHHLYSFMLQQKSPPCDEPWKLHNSSGKKNFHYGEDFQKGFNMKKAKFKMKKL